MENEQIIHSNEGIVAKAGKVVFKVDDEEIAKTLEKTNQILKNLKEAGQIIKSLSGEKNSSY